MAPLMDDISHKEDVDFKKDPRHKTYTLKAQHLILSMPLDIEPINKNMKQLSK